MQLTGEFQTHGVSVIHRFVFAAAISQSGIETAHNILKELLCIKCTYIINMYMPEKIFRSSHNAFLHFHVYVCWSYLVQHELLVKNNTSVDTK